MFAFAFSEIARYYRFLRVIAQRHRVAARRFMANTNAFRRTIKLGTHAFSRKQMRLHEQGIDLTLHVQLETEGFYLFAKILLDKIARALEFYFGPVPACALDSHDDLVRRIDRFAHAKALTIPAEFKEMASKLKKDVSDFRDYSIAHEKSPRTMRATVWDGKGNVRMMLTRIYPTAKDTQSETRAIQDLRGDLDSYLVQTMNLIRMNRLKTKLRIREHKD